MLSNKLGDFKIILASASPRRQQFLKDLDLDFTIETRSVDEIYPKDLKHSEITEYLAELKSQAFENDIDKNQIIISSDTIVWLNNRALEKPKDFDEALNMLRNLSGNTHEVISSVCIRTKTSKKIFSDTTSVTFRDLTNEEIIYYIQNYKPYDKAGAYGIQEWIGKIGVTSIKGSYFNVMGLPVDKLYNELLSFCINTSKKT